MPNSSNETIKTLGDIKNNFYFKFGFLESPVTFLVCTPIFFIILGLFSYRFQPTDPDIWWHLNVGKDILEKGIQFKDIYTFSMPGYTWTDHEWLLNCLFYFLFWFSNNFLALAIVFAVINFWCFYSLSYLGSQSKNSNKTEISEIALWFSFLLGFCACLTSLGIRAQSISLLGITIVLLIIKDPNWYQRKRFYFLLPLGFLLWANLHGAFIVGLFLLFLDLAISFKKKEGFKEKLIVFIACVLLPLINPYGINLYLEPFHLFLDHYAHNWIREWRAPDLRNPKYVIFIFYVVSMFAMWFWNHKRSKNNEPTEKSFNPVFVISSVIFLIMALRSVRHMPVFILCSLPIYSALLATWLDSFSKQRSKLAGKLMIFVSVFFFLAGFNFAGKQLNYFLQINTQESLYFSRYPEKAISFIKQNNIQGNILAEYSWGGFISWVNPKQKIFIDGRMPSWKVQKSKKTILMDFNTIIRNQKGTRQLIKKYNIDYLLLSTSKEEPKLMKQFKNVIYKDDISVIIASNQIENAFNSCGLG